MTIKTFLSGADGEKSSKRLGFILTLYTAIGTSILAIIVALWGSKYEQVVIIIQSIWWACFGFGGLVATEVLNKFFNKNDTTSGKN